MLSPVSSASVWSSRFHSRTPAPFQPPQSAVISRVGPAAISRDKQPGGGGIALPPHLFKPAADGVDRELGGVAGDANAHPTAVIGQVIDAVGYHFAKVFLCEVMHLGAARLPRRTVIGALVGEVADQLFLL